MCSVCGGALSGTFGSWWLEQSKKMKKSEMKGYWLVSQKVSLLNLNMGSGQPSPEDLLPT